MTQYYATICDFVGFEIGIMLFDMQSGNFINGVKVDSSLELKYEMVGPIIYGVSGRIPNKDIKLPYEEGINTKKSHEIIDRVISHYQEVVSRTGHPLGIVLIAHEDGRAFAENYHLEINGDLISFDLNVYFASTMSEEALNTMKNFINPPEEIWSFIYKGDRFLPNVDISITSLRKMMFLDHEQRPNKISLNMDVGVVGPKELMPVPQIISGIYRNFPIPYGTLEGLPERAFLNYLYSNVLGNRFSNRNSHSHLLNLNLHYRIALAGINEITLSLLEENPSVFYNSFLDAREYDFLIISEFMTGMAENKIFSSKELINRFQVLENMISAYEQTILG